MPYPRTILTRPIRRSIMVTLIILFFLIAPVIVLYTAGYRFDVATRTILQTGVLSVDVTPRTATVAVNGTTIEQSLPIRLPSLAPGSYDISISAPGYRNWYYQAHIDSKQTTYIRNISLLRDALPIEIFQDPQQRLQQVAFSPDGSTALIVERETGDEQHVRLFRTATGETADLFTAPSSTPVAIEWAPDRNQALITQQKQKNSWSTTLITPDNTDQNSLVVTGATMSYQWAPDDGVYIATPTSLVQLTQTRVRELQLPTNTTTDDQSLSLASASTWYIDADEAVWLVSESRQDIVGPTASFSFGEPIDRVVYVDTSLAVARSTGDHIVFIDRVTGQKTRVDGRHAVQNNQTGEWTVWNEWQIARVQGQQPTILTRSSRPMADVRLLDDEGALLLTRTDSLEQFQPTYYVTQPLFEAGDIRTTSVNTEERYIIFFGTVGTRQGIYSLSY